jgi:hypothetical protein
MLKPIVVTAGALVLLAAAAAGRAQQFKEITMDDVRTSLPVEGAPLADKGLYALISEPTFGAPGHVLVRPASLDAFPENDTLPVIAWGNGGCAIDSTSFMGFMETVASHGFLVIGTAPVEGEARRQANVDDMRGAIDWAEKENKRDGSPLEGKIAMDKVAAMGSSCGGFMSIEVGEDPRVKTLGVFNSGVTKIDPALPPVFPIPDVATLAKLHGPVLLVNGDKEDFMLETSKATYAWLENRPAFYGARRGAGHSATFFHPGGGEFANVAWSWAAWQLKGDATAGRMFTGEDCGLCKNPNWTVESKGLR